MDLGLAHLNSFLVVVSLLHEASPLLGELIPYYVLHAPFGATCPFLNTLPIHKSSPGGEALCRHDHALPGFA
jgi:hypothetical protein